MKFIARSMEGYTDYHETYSAIRNAETNRDSDKETSALLIPTLVNITRKVARYEGTHMDEKQHIAY